MRTSSPARRSRVAGALAVLFAAALLTAPVGPAAAAAPWAGTACGATAGLLDGAPVATLRPGAGIRVRAWRGSNPRGEPVQVTVTEADLRLARPAVAAGTRFGAASRTTDLTAAERGGLAGLNGDWFGYDLAGRAVPVGPQVRGGRVDLLPYGHSRFVGVGADGRPRTGTLHASGTVVLPARAGIAGPRRLRVTAVNPLGAAPTGVAVVTSYLWSAGTARARAGWEVAVRDGRVVASGRRVRDRVRDRVPLRARGVLVVAWGAAPTAGLRSLRVGDRVAVSWAARAQDGTRVVEAVGSGAAVLAGGRVTAACTGAGARSTGRALVGWDGRGRIWFVTVGSGGASRPVGRIGLTYAQTAVIARRLGARDAVLVDGGGSATVAVRVRRGASTVVVRVDAPAAATQRPVPNALVLVRR